MKSYSTKLKREEIFALALQAELMLVDGDIVYINDTATAKNLIGFVRLIESKQVTDSDLSKNPLTKRGLQARSKGRAGTLLFQLFCSANPSIHEPNQAAVQRTH